MVAARPATASPTGAFDADEPPDREAILDCVHCGICLPQCPTYRVLEQEMDSPRGRIYLMRAALEGRIGLTPNLVTHMDRCLGCRACETACPAGVPFGRLLEETRGQIERRVPRPRWRRWFGRAVLEILADRRRLGHLLRVARLYQLSGLQRLARASGLVARLGRLAPLEALLPPPGRRVAPLPREVAPAGPARGTVAVLEGCVQAALFPEVNRATVKVLARAGYRVVVPGGQGCCGALHLHWGDRAGARRRARNNVQALAGVDWVVANAAGCGATLREYGHLLPEPPAQAMSARVCDVTELLAAALPGPCAALPLRVTYHEPCHLAHGQRVREAPRTVLAGIPGLALVELEESDLCCGAAGVYSLLEPGIAGQLLDRKLDRIAATGADIVATGNPGCLLQIRQGLARRGLAIRAHHPVELLAWSLEGGGGPPAGG
jgi:glycolate oxidase iron-sulfur subunit